MRRQILRATPLMLKRAMAMQAPLDRHPPIATKAKPADARQLDLDAQPAERETIPETN